jgi:hypothetical protein
MASHGYLSLEKHDYVPDSVEDAGESVVSNYENNEDYAEEEDIKSPPGLVSTQTKTVLLAQAKISFDKKKDLKSSSLRTGNFLYVPLREIVESEGTEVPTFVWNATNFIENRGEIIFFFQKYIIIVSKRTGRYISVIGQQDRC